MPEFTQANRPLRITTPLGADVLLLERLAGEEGVSTPFRFELELLSERDDIDPGTLLGKQVSVEIDFGGLEPQTRYISGIVSRFSQSGPGHRLTRYRAELVPTLWIGSLMRDSRIFQQKSVGDVATVVLGEIGADFKNDLAASYEPWNFCVQYRESNLAFLSRILERDGIYYYHEHGDGTLKLVLADTKQAPACGGPGPRVGMIPSGSHPATNDDPVCYDLEREELVVSAKTRLWDHQFQMPTQNLEALANVAADAKRGDAATEVYDFPGGYAHHTDGISAGGGEQASKLNKILDENQRIAGLRMFEAAAPQTVLRAASNYPFLTAGYRFTLGGHTRSDFNGDYFLVRVRHEASVENYENSTGAPFRYQAKIEAIPAARRFVPPRLTPPARIEGSQTATVVGPQGQEIFTDKYGRVKVQFHWDRLGKNDSDSSCWVRVSSPYAGKNWGMIAIPRIGAEVVVDFLEGDPERPLITGMVYNPDFMPPYTLPDNKTQSGIKTRSTLKGGAENFNEIRFEDKKDSEQLYVHAEKDLDAVVENNETRKVGFEKKDKGDQSLEVFNNQTVKVGAGAGDASDGSQLVEIYKNQSVTVKTGDQTVEVTKGKQTVTVEGDRAIIVKTGNDTLTVNTGDHTTQVKTGKHVTTVDTGDMTTEVKTGNQTNTVSMGNVSVAVKMGNHTTKLDLGAISQEAMQGIELKVGQNSIKVDQMGITIKGMMVKIEGQVQTEVKGLMATVSGDAMLTVKGGITMIN